MSNPITRRCFFRSLAAGAVGAALPEKANSEKTIEYERLGDYTILTIRGGSHVSLSKDAFMQIGELNLHNGTVTIV